MSEEGLNPEEDKRLPAAVELGIRGGSAKSYKKTIAARKNASMPCHPGKKRGRPYKALQEPKKPILP